MGLRTPDPRSVCPLSSTEFVEPPPPRTKFLGTPCRIQGGNMTHFILFLMTLRHFHIITKRCRRTVPYRRTGFTFGSEQFSYKVITAYRIKHLQTLRCWQLEEWTTEQTGGNYIINQGWLTLLRARAQVVYEFRRHLFVCPWEY